MACLIPMAVLLTFLVMSLFGVGLDRMSLAALIIALGMLVDNAIVMVENIQVLTAEGMEPGDAAVQSAGELRVPLLTSSMTTAAAFLPIFLAESTVGEYTAPLFKVLTVALLCSWLLALTLIPLLCTRLLRRGKPGEQGIGRLGRHYQRLLALLLRHGLKLEDPAQRIESAVRGVLADGETTPDIGGTLGCRAVGEALLKRL